MSPFFFVFLLSSLCLTGRGVYIRRWAVFFSEIFGGPVVCPRARWPGASLRGLRPMFGDPTAHPRGIIGRGGSVRRPYTFILVLFALSF